MSIQQAFFNRASAPPRVLVNCFINTVNVVVGTPVTYTPAVLSGYPAPVLLGDTWKVNGIVVGTGPIYTPVSGDNAKTLTVEESWSNAFGAATSVSTGAVVGAAASAPVVVTAPGIPTVPVTGVPTVYTPAVITAVPAATLTNRIWKLNTVTIAGAVGATYTPVSTDVGGALTVTEVWTNSNGTVSTTSLPYTVAQGYLAPGPVTAPILNGNPQVGVLSTYTQGVVSGVPTPTLTEIRWMVTQPPPPGGQFPTPPLIIAYGPTYTPTADKAGQTLWVNEVWNNIQGRLVYSSANKIIAAAGATFTPTNNGYYESDTSMTPIAPSVKFSPDGTVQAMTVNGTYTTIGQWGYPVPTAGAGAGYQIIVGDSNLVGGPIGDTPNAWLRMDVDRWWGVEAPYYGLSSVREMSYFVQPFGGGSYVGSGTIRCYCAR